MNEGKLLTALTAERYPDLLDSLRDTLSNPKWDRADRVHDWRNYVLPEIRETWDDLSLETKVAVYAMAESQADSEEWD